MIPAAFVVGWLSLATTAGLDVGSVALPSLVDLNVADVATLCTLPGIGPKKAEAIVALRQRRPLTRVTQLLQVRGIGPRLLDRLRGRVTLRPTMGERLPTVPRTHGAQTGSGLRPGATPRP